MYARWVSLLCWFDLTTGEKPSFSKFVCVTILVAAIMQRSLTLGIVIALLASSFGRSMFLAFLNRSKIEATEESIVVRQEIADRRDGALGVEPAP